MNSVATWDLLTMTELYRNLKFSCRDLVSTAYTSLCCDKEKSSRDIKFLAASALYRDMGFSFLPVLCHDLKPYVATKKFPCQDNLCRDTKSSVATLNLLLPSFPVTRAWPGLSCAHGLLCHDTTWRHTVVCANLRTRSPVVCSRVFCHG